MQPTELKLHGVIAFPVTPFKSDLSLDLDGLRKNLRSLLKHPICAVVAAAGTGEFHSLSLAEHEAVVRATLQEVDGKVPGLAGVGINPPIARELATQSVKAGASGILAFPPYYQSMDDDGIVAYYQSIGQSTDRGVLIYSRDWFNPTAALVEKLAA